jgi:Arc/MetJ-type ribon-helix-helix transcriptional regulator
VAENVYQLRPKPSDSEKITINLGYVDLGHIDLMVQDGFYSNRTDFIRTAIRNQLERHAESSNSQPPERVWILVCGTIAART